MNAIQDGKAQGDWRENGDRGRPKRAETGDDGGDEEHHPGDQADASTHQPDGAFDQPVDGAVDLRDGEEVGDGDERQEQITRKARKNIGGFHADGHGAEQEGAGKGERAHVDRLDRRNDEHSDEQAYGQYFNTHDSPPCDATSVVVAVFAKGRRVKT